jgi:hypothetical protein
MDRPDFKFDFRRVFRRAIGSASMDGEDDMRAIIFALSLIIPISAQAASPLETYFSVRDGYIAKFTQIEDSGKYNDRTHREVQRALGNLEKQLQKIIGLVAVKEYSNAGKINLDTFVRSDIGFGRLDALVYASRSGSNDNKSHIYVTTSALFDQWFKEHRDNWAITHTEYPKDATAALASGTFYTFAISADAAFALYAELPIAKPAKAKSAIALLAARSQDDAPATPNEMIIAVLHETRVFVATAPVAARITPIPACQKVREQAEEKAEAAHLAYRESNLKDQDALDLSTRLREEGETAFLRCYAESAKSQPFFASLVKQAQELTELLPLK